MNLTERIKTLIAGEGFHKVGIASAGQLKNSHYLLKWIDSGCHGKMNWLKRNREIRINIEKYFPGAESVICVAYNYFADQKYNENRNSAKISRYAMGGDYHKIIKNKLKNVLKEIKMMIPGLQGTVCVDSSPVLEKLWAVEAGIGWQGKHSILISKEYGSWFFLGEIIINKTLDYDQPVKNLCGNCTKCIDACPTNAITTPYSIDATKCISYITIETKNRKIPDQIAEKMNNWIFGCDICQQVCPWNLKFQHSTGENYFKSKINFSTLNLSSLGKLTEDDFYNYFRESPIFRTGYKAFMRNVNAVTRFKSKNF